MSEQVSTKVAPELLEGVPELLRALWQIDKDPALEPLQDPKELALAREWLVRVLLDPPSFQAYVPILEGKDYYDAEFRYPPSRWDRWEEDKPQPATLPTTDPLLLEWWQQRQPPLPPPLPMPPDAFRPRQPLAKERALQIVKHGPEMLSRRQLAALLLSPLLLCELGDWISIQLPEPWLPHMERLGREVMKRCGFEVPRRFTNPPGKQPPSEDTDLAATDEETTI